MAFSTRGLCPSLPCPSAARPPARLGLLGEDC